MSDTKPDVDKALARFEGNYVESADLMQGGPVNLVIAEVIPPDTEKAADGRLVDKPILRFERAKKKMILNKTNVRVLKSMFGKKPSAWVGQTVTIGVRYVDKAFGQTNVPGLRIIPPPGVPLPHGAWKHMGSEKPKGKQRGSA